MNKVTKSVSTLKIVPKTVPTSAGVLMCLEDVDGGLGVELAVEVLVVTPTLDVVVRRVLLCELAIVEPELCGDVVAEVFVVVVGVAVGGRITVARELRGSKPFWETFAHKPPAISYSD